MTAPDRQRLAALLSEALRLHRTGATQAARNLYEQILALDPHHADALHLLGCLHGAEGRHDEAISLLRRAVEREPGAAPYRYNLANLLAERGAADEAEAHYRAALALKPDYAFAWNNLGLVLARSHRHAEAIACFREAIRLLPGRYADACHHLGLSLRELGDLPGAIRAYHEALRIAPGSASILFNLGNALRAQQQPEAAAMAYEQALQRDPRNTKVLTNLAAVELSLGQQEAALEKLGRAVELAPTDEFARHNAIMATSYLTDDPRRILDACTRWRATLPTPGVLRTFPNRERRKTGPRLKIGYVSADFRQHAAAYWIEPLLQGHDRERVEIVAYANQRRHDETTGRLRALCDGWVPCADMTDDELAQRIADDAIDVLVDLSGHTEGNRLAVFAQRPAPVQLTWFGFPGTTGLDAFDARLSDALIDPALPDVDATSTEPIERLERFYAAFRPDPLTPDPGPAPSETRGFVTFASLNNFAKITPSVLEIWAELLNRVPGARLIIQAAGVDGPRQRERIEGIFSSKGVPSERLDLRGWTDLAAFLRVGQEADIALDPFPFNGGVTTCHALWMGLPVVTLTGQSCASRVGASLLGRTGLDYLVAADERRYIDAAVALARDASQRAHLRDTLRERMAAAGLLDGADLAREALDVMTRLWRSKGGA